MGGRGQFDAGDEDYSEEFPTEPRTSRRRTFQDWLITDCNVWVSLLIGTVLMLIPMIMLALILLHFWPNGIGG